MPRFALLAALLLPLSALAGDTIDELEGVYKVRGRISMVVPGDKEQLVPSEDVLEIVRHDDKHAYFRTRLMFANGHSCSLHGIAEQRGSELVYRESAQAAAGRLVCEVKIARSGDSVTLTDRWEECQATSCGSYCGARGSLHDVNLPMRS